MVVLLCAGGMLLLLAGFSYRIPAFSRWEKVVFKKLYAINQGRSQIRLFRLLWPLGTTPFTVIVLLALILHNPRLGLAASLSLLCAALAERIIKLSMKRVRPFIELSDITMRQPRQPKDPSFPSGDSLRVWFLVFMLAFVFQWSWPYVLAVFFIALLITSGRIALGVHFPTDVLGGAGLGVLAAGMCLLILSSPLFG